MMYDVPQDPTTESEYECLKCGTIVDSKTHPGQCPECGEEMQSRLNSLE